MYVFFMVALFAGACGAMPTGNEVAPDVNTKLLAGNTTNSTTSEDLTTTEDPFCEGFRPGDDERSFQQFGAGQFQNFTCTEPLVWRQESCTCGARVVEIADPNCPHHRPYPDDPTKYEVRAHGVWLPGPVGCPPGQIWVQVNCWCDFDPNAPPTAPPSTTVALEEEIFTRRSTAPPAVVRAGERFVVTKGVLAGSEDSSNSPKGNGTGYYCESFRPGDEANKFQQLSGGRYHNFTCQPPLVWNQHECTCMAREVEITDPDCPHHRPYPEDRTKFEVRDHGVWLRGPISCPPGQVWNQTNCWCDYPWWDTSIDTNKSASVDRQVAGAPCFPIFNATFDHDILDDGQFQFSIGREPWPRVTMARNEPGAVKGAARVERARMPLWFTGGNPLGGKIQIKFRFKVNKGSVREDKDIVLLGNNRCAGGPKTISISFRASDERYKVFFRDYNVSRIVECNSRSRARYSFHSVDMIFFNELLTLTIDGEECFGALFETDLFPTACYIGLGSRNFDGFFDDVVIRRDCLEQEPAVARR